MPNTHSTLSSLFTDIADAIREKDGTSAEIVADNFPSRIEAIPTSSEPAKGFIFEDYDSDGYPHSGRFVGNWTEIPVFYLMGVGNYSTNSTQFFNKLTSVSIPNGVTRIYDYAFYQWKSLVSVSLPNTLAIINGSAFSTTGLTEITIPASVTNIISNAFSTISALTKVVYEGQAPNYWNYVFSNSKNVMEYDFSHCTRIPTLPNTETLGHKANCVIKVPQSLLADWQVATTWSGLTDVVWQGV